MLLPFVAPVNHSKVNESKTGQTIHTSMGNFCHGDKNNESQPEEMGNDACTMVAYYAKVSYSYLQQDVPNWNYLLNFLTKYFISIFQY
jgi:hypothetical protein